MRIVVDIDGVLCEQTGIGNVEEMVNAKPIDKNIGYVRLLYKQGHEIIIHTARIGYELDGKCPSEEKATKQWLTKNMVPYNKLMLNKPWADYYIEDRAIELGVLYEKLRR